MTGEEGTYNFELTIEKHQVLPKDGYIELKLPPQVSLPTPANQIYCQKGLLFDKDPICSTEISNGIQRIKVMFDQQTTDFVGPNLMSFQVLNLRNPFSTKSSDSFVATFKDTNSYIIA